MARLFSEACMGFFPFPTEAIPAVARLFKPANFTGGRLVDFCAGEGDAAVALSDAWKLTAFLNEYDMKRAAKCQEKVDNLHAIRGDFFTVKATPGSFNLVYMNPPFQRNSDGYGNYNRTEGEFLAHSWKYVARNNYLVFVCYTHHLTDPEVVNNIYLSSETVDVYRVPGFHLGAYEMVVTVCQVKDKPYLRQKDEKAAEALVARASDNYLITQRLLRGEAVNNLLMDTLFEDISTVTEPRYEFTPVKQHKYVKFEFAPKVLDGAELFSLAKTYGPQTMKAFAEIVTPKPPAKEIEVVIKPRVRQLMNLLASGLFNGIMLEIEGKGRALVRSVTRQVEHLVQTETAEDRERMLQEAAEQGLDVSQTEADDSTVMKFRTAPETTITLLYESGDVESISEDAQLISFIKANKKQLMEYVDKNFKPTYTFDFVGGRLTKVLDSFRLVKDDGKTFKLLTTQKHVSAAMYAKLCKSNAVTLCGQMGVGKASRNSARVYTPDGYKLMGEIQVGDEVINPDGGKATVRGVFPQGVMDIYRVTFSDGSSTEVTADHLWEVNTPYRKWANQPGRVKALREIMSKPLAHKNGNFQHFIPMVKPVEFRKRDLLLNPYLLGVLLGDGSLKNPIRLSSADQEIVDAVAAALPEGVYAVKAETDGYDYRLSTMRRLHNQHGWCVNPLLDSLKLLGLYGTTSATKFIPTDYLYSSVTDRMALLQGLMDTDGSVTSCGTSVEYVTVSKSLAQDVKELAQSLGATVSVAEKVTTYPYNGRILNGLLAYRLVIALPSGIVPFRLTRKAEAYQPRTKYEPTRAIVNVELIGQDDATCIYLDSDNHLYVTDDYIVTHNTVIGSALLDMMKYRADGDMFQNVYTSIPKESRIRPDQFNVIVCPPHLVSKWERELVSISPDAYVGTVRSGEGTKPIVEVMNFIRGLRGAAPDALKVLILSREMMKAGEAWTPAVISSRAMNNRAQRGLKADERQPRLFSPVTGREVLEPTKARNKAPKAIPYKRLENRKHFMGRKSDTKEFRLPKRGAKVAKFPGEYEDIQKAITQREMARNPQYAIRMFDEVLERVRRGRVKHDAAQPSYDPLWQETRSYSALKQDPGIVLAERLGLTRTRHDHEGNEIPARVLPFPDLCVEHLHRTEYINTKSPRAGIEGVAKFLAAYYGDQIYMTIFDEAHEYAAGDDSAQGLAMLTLAGKARKVVFMTGTLYKGVASSLYYLEFIVNPRIRFMYPWNGGESAWVAKMGVIERVVKIKSAKDGRNSGKTAKTENIKEVPGASPELLREIIDHTIFVGLADLGKALPDFEERGIQIDMDGRMTAVYAEAARILKDYLVERKILGDSSFLGAYFNALLNWPNWPYDPMEVWHNRTVVDPVTEKEETYPFLVYTIPGLGHDYVTPKERWLVNEVKRTLETGRGCAIYFRQTGSSKKNPTKNMLKRMSDLLKREVSGAKPAILTSKVKTGAREEWIKKHSDCNILLCNPNLVKTGLDLLKYPTIIWYELEFSLTTTDQASHRAWRLGQDLTCEVLHPFYVRGAAGSDGDEESFEDESWQDDDEEWLEGQMDADAEAPAFEKFITEDLDVDGLKDEPINVTGMTTDQVADVLRQSLDVPADSLVGAVLQDVAAMFMGGEGDSPAPTAVKKSLKANTMEAQGVVLMDGKRAAAAFLYGDENASLSAMSQGGADLKDLLAENIDKELVVDSSALFRQAVLDSGESDWSVQEADEQNEVTDEQPVVVVAEFVKPEPAKPEPTPVKPEDDHVQKLVANLPPGATLTRVGYDDNGDLVAKTYESPAPVEEPPSPVVVEAKPEAAPVAAEPEKVEANKVLPETERQAQWKEDVKKYGQPKINQKNSSALFKVDATRRVVWLKEKTGEYMRVCWKNEAPVYTVRYAAKIAA